MLRWRTTRFDLDLTRPLIMGIVNVTPDSFSDGGQCAGHEQALAHARQLLEQGADLLDIGGESTRPGAQPVDEELEWARIGPVLQGLMPLGVPLSVDTYKPTVMARALALGVDVLNDISGFASERAQALVAGHPSVGLCVMHMQGQPQRMPSSPHYGDVVSEVADQLRQRLEALTRRGVDPQRIILDPGIGFGKTPDHNLELLRRQRALLELGQPLLAGWSRKSTLGRLTGRAVHERQSASVAAALASLHLGASVVRVHDVAATRDAILVFQAAGLLP